MSIENNLTFVIDTNNYDTDHVSVKSHVCKTSGVSYNVFNLSCKDDSADPANSHYRSVISRDSDSVVIGIAPPKGMSSQDFMAKYPVGLSGGTGTRENESGDVGNMYVNEIIEGTMVNLFFDSKIGNAGNWEIATKSAVGGDYCYLRTQYPNVGVDPPKKTFRDMFLEACGIYTNEPVWGFGEWTSCLDQELVYSFVLQHPLNHIVGWVDTPRLFLVSVFRKHYDREDQIRVEYISPLVYESWEMFTIIPIYFPKWVPFHGNNEGYSELLSGMSNRGFAYPGVMITELTTGDRCRIDNPAYLTAMAIRGNHPNLQYHYLELGKESKIAEFLAYFPMYYDIFARFYLQLSEFVKGVYQAYVDRYIRKVVGEGDVPKRYAPHIWRLHNQIYVPSLEEGGINKKIVIREDVVWKYVIEMEVKEVLYYLNM